jgi:hypothetical protein
MTRSSFFLALGLAAIVVICSLCIAAKSGGDKEQSVENTLAVQKTIVLARDYLLRDNAKKAVEILEANLNRVNGDRKFLAQLREAYKAYVKDLTLANQPALAEVYQARLKILEDNEATMAALASAAPGQPVSVPLAKTSTPAEPAKEVQAPAPVARVETPAPAKEPVTPRTVEPKKEPVTPKTVEPKADPFDIANELKLAASGFKEKTVGKAAASAVNAALQESSGVKGSGTNPAPQTGSGMNSAQPTDSGTAANALAKAEMEFVQKHYKDAKQLYEDAYRADPKILDDDSRMRWAYCQLAIAYELLSAPPGQQCDWSKLEADVKTAMNVVPQLSKTGNEVLSNIAKRRGGPAVAPPTYRFSPAVTVKHTPAGSHGWQVAETEHFRILHNQTKEKAESVAQAAEFTRSQMLRKWIGKDKEEWRPKCDIYLYATAADYSRLQGQPASTPGHSQIELDATNGRVVVRQIFLHCDHPTMLDDVLPHETTHVVLAGQFGNNHVPRWLDEGVAVLSEPAEKIQLHRRNLSQSIQNKTLIHLRDLLKMDSYPAPAQIGTFYAQSVALVDYLTKLKGPMVLTQFVRDGLRDGYPSALEKHYGFKTVEDLETRFTERIVAEIGVAQPAMAVR